MSRHNIKMKTYKKLYEKICSISNLYSAFLKARKGKTKKSYVKEFEANLKDNLQRLHEDLINKTYKPSPLKTFILRDPKTRRISVSEFRDRIVHHAIVNVIEPIFDKRFIYDSYANRKGKCFLAAINRFDEFKRIVSKNGKVIKNKFRDNNYVKGYCLKADIKHYFDTVDHDVLVRILENKIKDKNLMQLINKILNNHNKKIKGKGMPLGNLTSQFFANVYLNELDQFIKHNLKIKYYIRYVDDFIILNESKQQLEILKIEINEFLNKELLIELHPQKSNIYQLARGIDFLGFRIFYKFRLLRKRNIKKMFSRINKLKKLYKLKKIKASKIIEIKQGWNAYAIHADTYRLRRTITNSFLSILSERYLKKTSQISLFLSG